jgi:tetratricopeptide (TPR) repeat protein
MLLLLPIEPDNRAALLRELIENSEKHLGPAFFEENHGHFWGVTETRPFMRTLQDLGDQLIDLDRFDEAITVFERMLNLNPGDNQGLRYRLLPLYLATRRFSAIAALSANYPNECDFSAVFAWGRVMELWLTGGAKEIPAALRQARKVNRFVEAYLTGLRRLPEGLPASYRPGDESEAHVAVHELSVALRAHPSFSDWLYARR